MPGGTSEGKDRWLNGPALIWTRTIRFTETAATFFFVALSFNKGVSLNDGVIGIAECLLCAFLIEHSFCSPFD